MPTTDKRAGFTDAEKAAMKARGEELRSSGRGGAKKAEEAEACLDAIATCRTTTGPWLSGFYPRQ
jgi:hypothetical protein